MQPRTNFVFGISTFLAYVLVKQWFISSMLQVATCALYLKVHSYKPKCLLLYTCALVTWVPLLLVLGCRTVCIVPMSCVTGVMYIELAQDVCVRMSKSDDDMDSIPL
jgi:hypothetical protein